MNSYYGLDNNNNSSRVAKQQKLVMIMKDWKIGKLYYLFMLLIHHKMLNQIDDFVYLFLSQEDCHHK